MTAVLVRNESKGSISSGSEAILTPASNAPSPRPSSDPHADLLPIERRALHHFLNRSAFEFSEAMASQFWRIYVPDLTMSSDAVLHAIIATSTLHEQLLTGSINQSDSLFALSQYQKAVKAANARLLEENAPHSRIVEETLTACALFVCIEVFLDAYPRALTHLHGGLQMLSDLAIVDPSCLSQDSPFSDIIELFTQYESQGLTYVGSLASTPFLAGIARQRSSVDWQKPVSNDINCGNYIEAARKAGISLRHIVRDAQHFMRAHAQDWKYEVKLPAHITDGQEHHLLIFNRWDDQIHSKLLQIPKPLQRAEVRAAIAQLSMQYHSTYIRLATCLSPNETTDYDNCLPFFQAILAAAEDMFSCPSVASRKFTIESPMVEHVYFVGVKCRDHALRTRAISILRRCGREGVWDGPAFAAAAEAAMRIEEAWTRDFVALGMHPLSVNEMDLNGLDDTGYEAAYIPEECRIHGLSIDLDKKNRELRIFDVECSRLVGGHWIREKTVVKY